MMEDHKIPEPDKKGLREFGLVTGGVGVGLFGLLIPWLLGRPWPLWPWVVFGSLALVGLVAPLALKPVYRGWMKFGQLASKVTTPIFMGLIFFGAFWPFGAVMRISGKDALRRRFDKEAATYRVERKKSEGASMKHPY